MKVEVKRWMRRDGSEIDYTNRIPRIESTAQGVMYSAADPRPFAIIIPSWAGPQVPPMVSCAAGFSVFGLIMLEDISLCWLGHDRNALSQVGASLLGVHVW